PSSTSTLLLHLIPLLLATLFPYTTLFRSIDRNNDGVIDHHDYTDGIPFNTNPMFVNALAGDFRLKTVSPCIGVGTLFSYYFTDLDRKSTRLNSSHVKISYAVFCLKKKKNS